MIYTSIKLSRTDSLISKHMEGGRGGGPINGLQCLFAIRLFQGCANLERFYILGDNTSPSHEGYGYYLHGRVNQVAVLHYFIFRIHRWMFFDLAV